MSISYAYTLRVSGSTFIVENAAGQSQFQSTSATQAGNNLLARTGNKLVKAGTYPLTAKLIGQGMNDIIIDFEDGAILFVGNGMNAPAIQLEPSANNWLLRNIGIDGNMANQADASGNGGLGMALFGVLINGGSYNVVDRAKITRCGQFGVFIANTRLSTPAVKNGVTNSTINYCGWNGVTIGVYQDPMKDQECYVKNNIIHNCNDVAVSTYAYKSQIEDNTIYAQLAGAGNNHGWNNAHTGVQVEGGSNNTIRHNNLTDCQVGLMTNEQGFDYNLFTLNELLRCVDSIALRSSHNTVTWNKIRDYNQFGGWSTAISCLNANDNEISDNDISSALAMANAFYIGENSNDNRVLRNTAIDSLKTNLWSIQVNNSSRTRIENNIFKGLNGVDIANPACLDTKVLYNDLSGITGTPIHDLGTGTVITPRPICGAGSHWDPNTNSCVSDVMRRLTINANIGVPFVLEKI